MQWIDGALGGVVAWVRTQPGIALLVLAFVQALLAGFAIAGWMKASRLARRQARILRGVAGNDLEEMLLDYAKNSEQVRRQIDASGETGAANTEAIRRGLRRVALVRYDAFENIGGKQSFSLALLDDIGSGILLTSLVSRQDMRLYAKPVVAGTSPMRLTDEEQAALRQARVPSEMDARE